MQRIEICLYQFLPRDKEADNILEDIITNCDMCTFDENNKLCYRYLPVHIYIGEVLCEKLAT